MSAKSLFTTVIAIAMHMCALAPAVAQDASSIAELSAVVEKVFTTPNGLTAALRVSVIGPDGNSVKAFDDEASPFGRPRAAAPRGVLSISVRLCDSFPQPTGTQCKWSPLQKIAMTNQDGSGAPGVYVVTGIIDDPLLNNTYLKDQSLVHSLVVRATIMPSLAEIRGNGPVTPIAARQVIVAWGAPGGY